MPALPARAAHRGSPLQQATVEQHRIDTLDIANVLAGVAVQQHPIGAPMPTATAPVAPGYKPEWDIAPT